MKKNITNLCSGDDSTSTLNQHFTSPTSVTDHKPTTTTTPAATTTATKTPSPAPPARTLEDMILQLELEEELSRKSKLDDHHNHHHHRRRDHQLLVNQGRLSCFNNSDILRSARNAALNQYPRFSLDGKDAMYSSSFHHNSSKLHTMESTKKAFSSSTNNVIWCKPGVVAKLMGLEAMPMTKKKVGCNYTTSAHHAGSREKLSSIMRKQSLRRIGERKEIERRSRTVLQSDNSARGRGGFRRGNHHHYNVGSCSNSGNDSNAYCLMKKPIHVAKPSFEIEEEDAEGWQTPTFYVKEIN